VRVRCHVTSTPQAYSVHVTLSIAIKLLYWHE
jgi:hypothetical protein